MNPLRRRMLRVSVAWGLILVAAVVAGSCRTASLGSLKLAPAISLFKDPFDNSNHVGVTRALAGNAVTMHRLGPPEAVAGKSVLTLEECRSITLKNNLDLQVAHFEEMAKQAIERSNRTKLLPHLSWWGELSNRDNMMFSYSDPMGQEGRAPGPAPAVGEAGVNTLATSHERSTWKQVWEAKWSPTDAALAFYLTKSARNDASKAHYQRIRTAQKLIGVVDAAYYRLLAIETCIPLAHDLVGVCQRTAGKINQLLRAGLRTTEDAHRARQRLIKARSICVALKNELERERNTLASAMAISPGAGTPCDLSVDGMLSVPSFCADPLELEMGAVTNRPEAYQAGLNHLNSLNDFKRTVK